MTIRVRYLANNTVADLSEEAARTLVDAGICERMMIEEPTHVPPKGRKPR